MNITLNINISLFNSSNKTDGNKKKNKKQKKIKEQNQSHAISDERNIPNKTEISKKLGVMMKTIAMF
jgi:hypothetical protein